MRHDPQELKQLQSLPLDAKIRMTQERIKVWYESWWRFKIENLDTGKIRWATFDMRDRYEPPIAENEFALEAYPGSVYVSFSGGKDSTVLKHIVDGMYDDVPAVFVNTGLEYPEIQKFAKAQKNVTVLRPEMRFDQVIKKYGYPAISKEVSEVIYSVRHSSPGKTKSVREKRLNGELLDNEGNKSRFNCESWKFMLDAPFEVANHCCAVMKKKPSKQYAKETGRMPMLATMATESRLRHQKWMKFGCNAFEQKNPTSQPMSFWTEQDVLHYLKKYDVPYCSVYGDIRIKPHGEYASEDQIDMIDYLGCYEPEDTLETTGCDRTGCIFCMFGCHLEKEPNRFQRLEAVRILHQRWRNG